MNPIMNNPNTTTVSQQPPIRSRRLSQEILNIIAVPYKHTSTQQLPTPVSVVMENPHPMQMNDLNFILEEQGGYAGCETYGMEGSRGATQNEQMRRDSGYSEIDFHGADHSDPFGLHLKEPRDTLMQQPHELSDLDLLLSSHEDEALPPSPTSDLFTDLDTMNDLNELYHDDHRDVKEETLLQMAMEMNNLLPMQSLDMAQQGLNGLMFLMRGLNGGNMY